MNWLEDFFNKQTDMDWGWGPFVRYRPAQTECMSISSYLFYFMIIVAGVILSVLLISMYWLLHTPAHVQPSLLLFVYLCLWTTQTYLLSVAVAVVVSIGVSYIYITAWNRRALRLTRISQK